MTVQIEAHVHTYIRVLATQRDPDNRLTAVPFVPARIYMHILSYGRHAAQGVPAGSKEEAKLFETVERDIRRLVFASVDDCGRVKRETTKIAEHCEKSRIRLFSSLCNLFPRSFNFSDFQKPLFVENFYN